jgi:hypothetical protein
MPRDNLIAEILWRQLEQMYAETASEQDKREFSQMDVPQQKRVLLRAFKARPNAECSTTERILPRLRRNPEIDRVFAEIDDQIADLLNQPDLDIEELLGGEFE